MSEKLTGILIGLLYVAAWSSAGADETRLSKISLNGVSQGVRFAAGQPIPRKLTFWGVSKGNSSTPVTLYITAPNGATFNVREAQVVGSEQQTLASNSNFFQRNLKTDADIEGQSTQCIDFSQGDLPGGVDISQIVPQWAAICDVIPSDAFNQITQQLVETYGGSWSRERVCGYIVLISGNPNISGGIDELLGGFARLAAADVPGINYTAILSKDACKPKSTKYILAVDIDLTHIDRQLQSTGFQLSIRAYESKFQGSKAATIKPSSAGRFAPRPIYLMSYVNFCGQELNVVQWRGRKIRSIRPLPVMDLINYRDLVLVRGPVDSVLTGGMATFELTDFESGYGACFELARKRQRVNRYPG